MIGQCPWPGVDASDCYVLLPGTGGRFGVGKGWTRLRRWPPCGGLVTGPAISDGAPSFKAVRPDQARPEHNRAPGARSIGFCPPSPDDFPRGPCELDT